jgi:Ca2+-binding EF-hand superfamily protein
MGTSYDVSQSLVTEAQLRSKFRELDTKGVGYITKAQTIQFYRKMSLFGAEESDAQIVRFLQKFCPHLNDDLVTFDEFTQVSLKLAQQ